MRVFLGGLQWREASRYKQGTGRTDHHNDSHINMSHNEFSRVHANSHNENKCGPHKFSAHAKFLVEN